MPPARGNYPLNRISAIPKCWSFKFFTVILWALFFIPCAQAQKSKPTDSQVKAVYLINFARFVEWPDKLGTQQDSFTICVLGPDPFGRTLDTMLAGEKIAGRSAVAKRISTPQDSFDCRILFVSSVETGSINRMVEAASKQGVLTVSDMPHFTNRGGMIQFVTDDKRVRFEVNLTAAQRAGLTLSSELLKVATVVRTNETSGDQ
jgi:YfiR/HmsC-like